MTFGLTPGPMYGFLKPPSGQGVTGRPKGRTTRAKPLFARHPNTPKLPEFLQSATDLMNTYGSSQLPPGLMPRWMLNKKNTHISQGMTKGT